MLRGTYKFFDFVHTLPLNVLFTLKSHLLESLYRSTVLQKVHEFVYSVRPVDILFNWLYTKGEGEILRDL